MSPKGSEPVTHSFVMQGNLVYTPEAGKPVIWENGFLVVENGRVSGCFAVLPESYRSLPVERYEDKLIIPGLCDTHLHAPQYAFRGLGMDLELLEWLDRHAFPEEARYASLPYAQTAYTQFVNALQKSATTRASVFATLHAPATLLLARLMENAGMAGFVGKVSMDRNAPDDLREKSAAEALKSVREWLNEAAGFRRVKPILTPRFIPSCTNELMDGLAALRRREGLPLQSHLSENHSEIRWVAELCPEAGCYGEAYALHGLMDEGANTVMAHGVHPTEAEIALLKKRGVLVSHCPASNDNLASGIAPIRRYLDEGVRVGLGTDIAGGFELSLFRAMTDAVQASKLRYYYDPARPKPLSLWEAFYLGTKGGGSLFGKVGSFEPGYEADAVVLDDSAILSPAPLTVKERMERAVYLDRELVILAKYVAGERLSLPDRH